jgi:hypothetical protein
MGGVQMPSLWIVEDVASTWALQSFEKIGNYETPTLHRLPGVEKDNFKTAFLIVHRTFKM